MIGNWITDQSLDTLSNALTSAYGLAKEWQILLAGLLAGLLVLAAALVVARAIRKGPGTAPLRETVANQARLDLRREPRAVIPLATTGELAGELEQLRSLIRSALSAFTLTAEQENSPVQFLCQRVARLRPERFPLPVSATQAQRSLYAEVLEQLDMLRQQLKREIKPAEMSGTLIKLNTSARNLIATLEPQLVNLRQVRSEQR
jgi:HAMP domain-containing protein